MQVDLYDFEKHENMWIRVKHSTENNCNFLGFFDENSDWTKICQ